MSATTKDLSALQMSVRYGISENSARLFMQKVREAMKSNGLQKMSGDVQVDEFVIGGHEEDKQGRSYHSKKKKIVCAIELTEKGKVKRFYANKIEDFSAKSLRTIFDKHIDKSANVTTDEWKGYKPIKDFNINQIPSDKGKNFLVLHTIIHQVKSWLRTIYCRVSDFNIDRYLAEFSYRINRSQSKNTIFNNLIKRMVDRPPVYQRDLVCS